MDEHDNLFFCEKPLLIQEVSKKLPEWCINRLISANTILQYDFKDNRSLLKQKLFVGSFSIELIQIKSNSPFYLNYMVEDNRIFIFLMLDGNICFTSTESIKITKAKKNHFYISAAHAGKYGINSLKGNSLALVISIDQKWVIENINIYTSLNRSVHQMLKNKKQFAVMPHCQIDEKVGQWIEQLLSIESSKQKILSKMFEGYISRGLEYYEDLLNKNNIPDIYTIKEYLDENFCDPELSMDKLTSLFSFTKRTLYNHFMDIFQTTAVQYYTTLRMDRAKKMIEEQGFSIAEVWVHVGYRDQNTFRQAYVNYCNTLEEYHKEF